MVHFFHNMSTVKLIEIPKRMTISSATVYYPLQDEGEETFYNVDIPKFREIWNWIGDIQKPIMHKVDFSNSYNGSELLRVIRVCVCDENVVHYKLRWG